MSKLKHLKTKISSIKSTQKTTKAMKMVSTARLKSVRDRLEALRDYRDELWEVLRNVTCSPAVDCLPSANPLFRLFLPPSMTKGVCTGRKFVIVMSPDRGLCGSLNSSILKYVKYLLSSSKQGATLYFVGAKVRSLLESSISKLGDVSVANSENVKSGNLHRPGGLDFVLDEIRRIASNPQIDSVSLVYPEFVSAILNRVKAVDLAFDEGGLLVESPYVYDVELAEIAGAALEAYLDMLITSAIYETLSSEHSTRMIAMDSASNNASKAISKLTLRYNQIRQSNITQEISEIIGGVESA